MTRKRTSAVESRALERNAPVRVALLTMDPHLASAADQARATLRKELPGLELDLHAAAEFAADPQALQRCCDDIATADLVVVTMLFMEEHFQPVIEALRARREQCDAMVCIMSASPVTQLTRMGAFRLDVEGGPLAWLKRLRGKPVHATGDAGARQMRMLRRLPKILRFIPGTAQDVRAYFLALQYWLGGSQANLVSLVRFLIDRYAAGPRQALRGALKVAAPIEYPEIGVYHPRARGRIVASIDRLPPSADAKGTVGVLVLRSYALAGNTAHYDAVINALEARGLRVLPVFASGLDARPAIERFFLDDGRSRIDALLSLTGFSLVGGPAYNDAAAAVETLQRLDAPYIVAHPVEFQTLEDWQASERGLLPIESIMMVAIPELDGAVGPTVFGGRSSAAADGARDMRPHLERIATLTARLEKLVALRRTERAQRRIALVLFNFPPNAGAVGSAAHLAVFESLHNTLRAMQTQGYAVDPPETVEALRERILTGNASRFGAHANVHARVPVEQHVRRERWLAEIEAHWGPAPGRVQSDAGAVWVLGERFGNVFVGVQPAFGYEGDPMRLLFEKGFAPTHAFAAFYRWIREDFAAHAVLHFGTHGALEFMPGKQTALSTECWPDRLIADLPNFYLYASNNPSEGAIARRRSAATLVSYLTPPIAQAGLYRGLLDLKSSLDQWRMHRIDDADQRRDLAMLIHAQAMEVDLASSETSWAEADRDATIAALHARILELEYTLIPHGLHVVGQAAPESARIDMLRAFAATHEFEAPQTALEALVAGAAPEAAARIGADAGCTTSLEVWNELARMSALLAQDHEAPALLAALDGRYIAPAPGGDLLRNPAVLPTGRNVHGFDPFRIPSAFALREGAKQAEQLLARHLRDAGALPETLALVLWGTDNLKTEGGPIAQALALLGAAPRFDSYGRLAGAVLSPLAQLGRPRIDVLVTLSGIFRDLLPLQAKLLAEACYLAASADEPIEANFVRKHALAHQAAHGGDLESAALRIFSNADGAYGANVNHMIENGRWRDEDELAETYMHRKAFAFSRTGRVMKRADVLDSVLRHVDAAFQNLDSVELGVTTIDHYFDTLGGVSRAVRRARNGANAPVYVGDMTKGAGVIRSLDEQVALEAHTRMLNPKWYEGMLSHGYEGVRQIEAHVTNTLGWSATTGQVAPWVYQRLTQTFLLDEQMRARLAALNPAASVKVANRLLEAHERSYWQPDPATLEALRRAGEDLEDRLEGVFEGVAA